MKRFLAMIVAMCSIIVAMAQHPMATLSHNGELTQFTSVYALQKAIAAAEDGDVIYLSEGEFLNSGDWYDQHIGVDRRISIVGCGYHSYILSDICIAARDEYVWDGQDIPVFDGVRLKNVWFAHDNGSKERLNHSLIKNCWIENLGEAAYAGKELHIEGCFINNMYLSDGDGDVYLKNSKVSMQDGDERIMVTNSNLKTNVCPRLAISSIIERFDGDTGSGLVTKGSHLIQNSLLSSEELVNNDRITCSNCYFENPANGLLDENLNATIDLNAKGYLGQDGTIIGAYGGENPFSEYPSVPSIDPDKSSVEFDPTTNKLNVTITVASN